MNIDDTIVAISSPPGASERGIVRLSGPRAVEILQRLLKSAGGEPIGVASHPMRFTDLIAIESEWLDVSVLFFPAGRSYTGQMLAEFHVLGAPTLLGMVVEACLSAGARRADAGEFTARAYMAGRLDLSQAHGVAGMIAAQTDHQLRAAERLLHGSLGEIALKAREELADLLSLVEGAMDFADEPIEFIDADTLCRRLRAVHQRLVSTASAGIRAERWGQLPRVVLVGRPNAGKSSLLNRLSGIERAISTSVAGTTRDALSTTVDIGGIQCRLTDVAGAFSEPPAKQADARSIEFQAHQVAMEAQAFADFWLVVFDLSASDAFDDLLGPWLPGDTPRILVANKLDVASPQRIAAFRNWCSTRPEHGVVLLSARTGEGCPLLTAAVRALLEDRGPGDGDAAIALMAEHRDALEHAIEAIERAIGLAAGCDAQLNDADLAATEMRIAAESLGRLVGMDHTEDMLGRIFARFCVGK